MKRRNKLSSFNKFLSIVLVIVLVATVCVVKFKSVPKVDDGSSTEQVEDTAVIDEFSAGTYGGVNFASQEDIVNYYVEAYNKTKAKTATYITDSGEHVQWYDMLGEEDLQVSQIKIDGQENSMINNLVPTIVGGLFTKGVTALAPSSNRNPNDDVDEDGKSLTECRLVADDVLAANVKDNGDGTITLQLQPKQTNMSHKGADAQGHMFNTLGAIDSVVDSIKQLSWSTGTTAENCLVDYRGGYATVTVNTKTGFITTADYHMEAHISVNHACVAVLKDKSATLLVTYDVHYPASADYLMQTITSTKQ